MVLAYLIRCHQPSVETKPNNTRIIEMAQNVRETNNFYLLHDITNTYKTQCYLSITYYGMLHLKIIKV